MYERKIVGTLRSRMEEPVGLIQVLVGPRQTGKSTALQQASESLTLPVHFVSADMASTDLLQVEWQQARNIAAANGECVFIVDEIQKITGWSTTVKMLWDEDRRTNAQVKVFLSGSSSLLIGKGLGDSLMGRFELLRSPQWSFQECVEAFGYSLDEYIFFGGYPRSSEFISDEPRWRRFMVDSIIEPTISQDVLELSPVKKPALMRELFSIGVQFSSQELSFNKMLGQLQDAGNTVTLAEYLRLLSAAGMLSGLQKFDRKTASTRKSSPCLMAHDTSLQSSMLGASREVLQASKDKWGHLVETAVGSMLLHRSLEEDFGVFWWREGNNEVDFVLQKGESITAIEVKSGKMGALKGMEAFLKKYPQAHRIIVGSPEVSLEAFLREDVALFL